MCFCDQIDQTFESVKQIRSLMLREIAASIAALRVNASATRVEVTIVREIELCMKLVPAESEHILHIPHAQDELFQDASEKQRIAFS